MTPQPTIVIRTSPRISAIRVVLALVALFIAIFLGLLVLLLIGIETGPVAFLLGFVTATIPVPLYIALVLWIDRYEGEPLWMLATAFFWGALIATFFAFLLNTSRGRLIDETALADALNAGRIAGAGLDVLAVEPPPAGNPLLKAKNCFITPHMAWGTRAARSRLMKIAIENIRAFLNGRPQNVVN